MTVSLHSSFYFNCLAYIHTGLFLLQLLFASCLCRNFSMNFRLCDSRWRRREKGWRRGPDREQRRRRRPRRNWKRWRQRNCLMPGGLGKLGRLRRLKRIRRLIVRKARTAGKETRGRVHLDLDSQTRWGTQKQQCKWPEEPVSLNGSSTVSKC